MFSLRDPRTGRSHTLRRLDAVVAHACNGNRTLMEVFEVAQKHGSSASTEMIADVVRKLKSLGVLEQDARPEHEGIPFEVTSDDLAPVVAAAKAMSNAFEDNGREENTSEEIELPNLAQPSAPWPPAPPSASAPPLASAPPRIPPALSAPRGPVASAPPRVLPVSSAPRHPVASSAPVPPSASRFPSSARLAAVQEPSAGPLESNPYRVPDDGADDVHPESPAALAEKGYANAYDDFRPEENTRIELGSPAGALQPTGPIPEPASEGAAEPQSALAAGQLQALESLAMPKAHEAHQSQQRGSRLPWVLLVLLAAGGGGFYFYKKPSTTLVPPPENPSGFKIEIIQPETRSGQALVASGYLSAPNLILVGATVAGRIKEVSVVTGTKVKKNQVLIVLDDTQILSELQYSQAKLRNALRTRTRTRNLFKAEAATQADMDNADGQAEIAAAETNMIGQRLQQTKVRSPIEGTIIEVPVHPGEVIQAGDPRPLIKLADLTTLLAEIDVNEADAPMARLGQMVEIQTDAVKDRTFEGNVSQISQQVDKARGTVLVGVELKHPAGLLRPGLSVKATFRADASAAARILLQRTALEGGSVWLVGKDGTATKVPVTVQAVGPTMVEVTKGLSVGDRVVVDGFSKLHEGQKVF